MRRKQKNNAKLSGRTPPAYSHRFTTSKRLKRIKNVQQRFTHRYDDKKEMKNWRTDRVNTPVYTPH